MLEYIYDLKRVVMCKNGSREKKSKILKMVDELWEFCPGIYPKAVIDPNHPEKCYDERNDYQNGWNAGIMEYTEGIVKILGKYGFDE